jgi:hypothetical protein
MVSGTDFEALKVTPGESAGRELAWPVSSANSIFPGCAGGSV